MPDNGIFMPDNNRVVPDTDIFKLNYYFSIRALNKPDHKFETGQVIT